MTELGQKPEAADPQRELLLSAENGQSAIIASEAGYSNFSYPVLSEKGDQSATPEVAAAARPQRFLRR